MSKAQTCPQCLESIEHKVRNRALEEMLQNDTKEEVLERKKGMATISPDFDEDPESVAARYKSQLDQLNSRITLLENEKDAIEKAIRVYLGKNPKIESVPVGDANIA
jgi:hypothetical protein